MKFRHELKYSINYSDYITLKNRLKLVMKQDKHASCDGTYFIRSLYFDNLYDKALREKIDGVNNREKFRIRFYNMDDSVINLEKKSKLNGLCNKISTSLTKEETLAIINGDIEFLKESKDALGVEFYGKIKQDLIRPKTIVDYLREPYILDTGNVRVTFDSKIRTGIYHKDIFSNELPMMVAGNDEIILEVKYDNFLPELITMMLQVSERRNEAFSKYASARMYG